MVQCGDACGRTGHVSLWEPLVLIGFVVGFGAVAVPLLGLLVSRSRRLHRGWRSRRRRSRAALLAESRARALMGELCPDGWRAQITLIGSGGQAGGRGGVELEWSELSGDSGSPAVKRRVSAPTIAEALEAMVADRRTDETLEQIEHGAEAAWPD
jgi:hypothetical protein